MARSKEVPKEQPGEWEKRYRTLVEKAPLCIHEIDLTGRLLAMNPAGLETMGIAEECNVVGVRFLDVVDEGARDTVEKLLNRGFRGETTVGEFIASTARGPRLFTVTFIPDQDTEGNVVKLICFAQDLTDERRAETELRESEERFRLMSDTAPVLIWMSGIDKLCNYFNKAWLEFRGRTQEQEEGNGWTEGVHPDDLESCFETYSKAFDERVAFRMEYRLMRHDGEYRWILDRGVPRFQTDGSFRGYIGSCIDIAEFKQAEQEQQEARDELDRRVGERTKELENAHVALEVEVQERRRAEENLRAGEADHLAVLNAIPDLILRVDRKGRFLDFIPAENFPLTPPKDFLGKTLFDWLPPSVAHPGMECLERALQSHESEVFECSLDVRGNSFHYEARFVPCRQHEVLILVRDITGTKQMAEERLRLEGQLQHAQKLESLGVLAGGIAHDFNNLLTGVLGNAEIALTDLPPEAPARTQLQAISTAAQRAAELTKQMLAYSGKGRFVVQHLNLSTLVEEMANLLEVSISKKAVVSYNFARDLPPIEADATQIRQIIMNLMTNGSEAIGSTSGSISVSTGVMEADRPYLSETYLDEQLPEGCYVYLEVSDTGCGFEAETMGKLFDPFFTTKFTGRGLGLAAVLGIVRGHGGAVKVSSEPARGSTFRVLFPCSEEAAKTPTQATVGDESWRGSGMILVVDDEEIVRRVTKMMLESVGFTVLMAQDGLEALEVFRRRADEIVLVVLDLTMPNLDGEETLRELLRIRPNVKTILSSGYNEQDLTDRFAGKGLSAFIQKPYRPDQLRERVRQALEGNSGNKPT